jgi:hypothetical protein
MKKQILVNRFFVSWFFVVFSTNPMLEYIAKLYRVPNNEPICFGLRLAGYKLPKY